MNVLFGLSVAFRVLFSIAVYAVCAYSLYKIAKRNGVRYPYLAFIPIVQYYVIGSICEEYVLWGYRIKHLSVVLSLLLLVQTATGIMGIFSAMLINFAASALIALIMHKFYYLFMPQYALILAIISLIGGQLPLAIILFFIKDKPMLMSAAAYQYPFGG